MSATIFLLAYAPLFTPGLAPQRTLQGGPTTRASAVATPVASSRAPVDVSLRGLDEVTTGLQPVMALPTCSLTIKDVTTGNCIAVDSTPTLGRLYPLGPEFNIDGAGNVGIGTTTPAAKLEVTGTARVTDTLTLAPSGDQALDVSTGSIYKGGALFIHTKGGARNTALGQEALGNVTTGSSNTAIGYRALYSNSSGVMNTANGYQALTSNSAGIFNTAIGGKTLSSNTTGAYNTASGWGALSSNTTGNRNTASGYLALLRNTTGTGNTASGNRALSYNTTGSRHTASGSRALESNTTGYQNTASGYRALSSNTTGSGNTASGSRALDSNTTGFRNAASGYLALYSNMTGSRNTACGSRALFSNTTGSLNIAIGSRAGLNLTTGVNNIIIGNYGANTDSGVIRIGTSPAQATAFMAGIRGVTTVNANAIPVLIDSVGQLGTISSSRRFKEDIQDMGEATEKLLELRPVVFRYRQHVVTHGDEAPLEYGLIAEEVAEVFPELVVNDEEGEPFTVKYHLLSSMLLNEMQRQNAEKDTEIIGLKKRLSRLEQTVASLTR